MGSQRAPGSAQLCRDCHGPFRTACPSQAPAPHLSLECLPQSMSLRSLSAPRSGRRARKVGRGPRPAFLPWYHTWGLPHPPRPDLSLPVWCGREEPLPSLPCFLQPRTPHTDRALSRASLRLRLQLRLRPEAPPRLAQDRRVRVGSARACGLHLGNSGLPSIPVDTPKPPTPPMPPTPPTPPTPPSPAPTEMEWERQGVTQGTVGGRRALGRQVKALSSRFETWAQLVASPSPGGLGMRILPTCCPPGKGSGQVVNSQRPEGFGHVPKGNTHQPWQLYRPQRPPLLHRAPEPPGRCLQERPRALPRGEPGEALSPSPPGPDPPGRSI